MRNYIFKLMAELECARYYLPHTCPLKNGKDQIFVLKKALLT